MRDKDTKILEEAYNKINERYRQFKQRTGVETVLTTLTKPITPKEDKLAEDIVLDVEFDIYHGTTPSRGDDPNNIEITNITVAEDYEDPEQGIEIPAGTSLSELEDEGWIADREAIDEEVYNRTFNSW